MKVFFETNDFGQVWSKGHLSKEALEMAVGPLKPHDIGEIEVCMPGMTELIEELANTARVREVAERMVRSGPVLDHVTCSEIHEVVDWVVEISDLILKNK